MGGLCYHYEADGCHGDCRADRLAYLTTSGDFERPESLGVLYWKQLSKMFGVPRFDYVFAGGLDVDRFRAAGRKGFKSSASRVTVSTSAPGWDSWKAERKASARARVRDAGPRWLIQPSMNKSSKSPPPRPSGT